MMTEPETRVYHGDFLGVSLDTLVDVTITSPPYNLDMTYAGWSDRAPSYNAYIAWTHAWISHLYELTRPNGRLCLNIPLDTNKGGKQSFYADIVTTILASSVWKYQTTIVWNESNISRRTAWGSWRKPSAPFVTAPVEMIVVFYRDEWRRPPHGRHDEIDAKDFQEWTLGLWTFPGANPRSTGHPAAFPEELPRRLITLYSYKDDVIFDPFCGSGTTLVAASKLGRSSIGVDISMEYCERTRRRLETLTCP